MDAFKSVTSRTVVLPMDNVDTDQIIPARFLKVTHKEGLGESLFADWRYDRAGRPRPDFVLNQTESEDASILVAGDNFGCGSSREHAPWALVDYGFRAVIGASIADIFKANALKNGLLPVVVEGDIHEYLLEHPGEEVTVDLEHQILRLGDGREVSFPVDAFARYCLLNAMDELDFLLAQGQHIEEYESRA
jgi:3-isopropylmalate/(R)-2-methylmalate dehydratase small subunit